MRAEIRGLCIVDGKIRVACILVEKTETGPLGRRKSTCEDNIKLNIKYTGNEFVIRDQLSRCGVEGRLTVSSVLDIRLSLLSFLVG
jgi:hypothetical protein